MLDELQPMGLHDVAETLGVDPFEVVRLCVVNDVSLDRFQFTRADIDRLRGLAGLEDWWTGNGIPSDSNPRRGRIRGALKQLVEKKIVGQNTTRLDNVWRGLDEGERVLLEQAVTILVQDGHLATSANSQGVQISVNPSSLSALEKFANGGDGPQSLSALWMG